MAKFIKLNIEGKDFTVKVQEPKKFSWGPGSRSHVGKYFVMSLINTKRFWVGLLKYPPESFQPLHKDPTGAFASRHYKINLVLKEAKEGGFKASGKFFKFGPLVSFRADTTPHQVLPCSSERIVLSMSIFI